MTHVAIVKMSIFQTPGRKAMTVNAAWSYPWKIKGRMSKCHPLVSAETSLQVRANLSPVRTEVSLQVRADLSPVRVEDLKQVMTRHKDFLKEDTRRQVFQ